MNFNKFHLFKIFNSLTFWQKNSNLSDLEREICTRTQGFKGTVPWNFIAKYFNVHKTSPVLSWLSWVAANIYMVHRGPYTKIYNVSYTSPWDKVLSTLFVLFFISFVWFFSYNRLFVLSFTGFFVLLSFHH